MRGTNLVAVVVGANSTGSSPHARDKCRDIDTLSYNRRIIPACAGQIEWKFMEKIAEEDHPRMRGTNVKFGNQFFIDLGSSPHARDKFKLDS